MKAAILAAVLAITGQVAENNTGKPWTFDGWLRPEPPSSCALVTCVNGFHKYTIFDLTWQVCRLYVEKAKGEGGGGGTCI